MNEKIIETRTLDISVIEAGSGPLVLLCHGFPETKWSWRHQIGALAEAGYRVVAPDLRGYGGSDAPEDPEQYTVFHAVGDLVALLDALGAREAAIVGNDWGATIAWQAALLRPDRFRAIMAMSVPMMGQPPAPPSQIFPQNDEALFYALYFQQPGVADAELERDAAVTLRKLLYAASGDAGPRRSGDGTPNPFGMLDRAGGLLSALPDPMAPPDWLAQADFDRVAASFKATGFTGGLNYYRNLDRNWELQQAFIGKTIDVPAMFMIGDRDPGLSIPGMDDIIASMPALVPQLLGTHRLPGAGHWLPLERPDEVTRGILELLGDASSRSGWTAGAAPET